FLADEADGAGAEAGCIMGGAGPEGFGEEIEDQSDAVGVFADNFVFFRRVLNRHRFIRLVGPLAEIDGVGSPVEQPRTRVEIPLAAPFSVAILLIEGAPGSGAEPEIPVNHL